MSTASKLIYNYKEEENKVENIEKNQEILLRALDRIPFKKIILDGHFCILNKDNEISRIPYDTFENMNMKVIVLCTESVDIIVDRLRLRDKKVYTKEFINEFQNEESRYANEVAKKLNINFLEYGKDSDVLELNKILKEILL